MFVMEPKLSYYAYIHIIPRAVMLYPTRAVSFYDDLRQLCGNQPVIPFGQNNNVERIET